MSWIDVFLSIVFVLSAAYLLKLSRGIRLPDWLRLRILQDSRLLAVSLPPRPSFSRHRKHVSVSSRVSYAATAFTLDRALRSYSRYELLARSELSSKRRGLNDLRGRHARIATEIGYNKKLDRFHEAITINNLVASNVVKHAIVQKDPVPSDMALLGAYGANRWSDDGPTDLSRVVEALKHCVRDWSSDANEERTRVFAPILDVLRQIPVQQRSETKVLVPGAGLCRLAWEIARMGFDVTANEVSSYMTLPFRMLLDKSATPAVNCHTVCPHYSWFSHTRSNASLFQSAEFPDTLPRVDKDGALIECRPNKTPDSEISDDYYVSVKPSDRGYDFIVTLFFIDTATNILAYLDQIHALLRSNRGLAATHPGPILPITGTWINLGPLLWPPGASLEPSLEEVLALSERVGLSVVGEHHTTQSLHEVINPVEIRRTLECQYTANRAGMMKWMYQAEFWVAKRRDD
ncbi:hypothetical protein RSOL_411980 [Rhizoctonia solani AG-3 Rhs1AP]|uniref:Uncharacterized protein n=1 Tax=Rhizoctonia solani AG-3 Rhs1AP TaxID=1086054 RepID=X8JE34_9AGAM|nr:hypothetical protein RSOL_411980 [Rhizoctonia solani AG-3 Rhs1AP]